MAICTPLRAFLIVCFCLVGAFASQARQPLGGLTLKAWHKLHTHELQALRAYDLHVTTEAIGKRANDLFELSFVFDDRALGTSCGAAARTLSFMIRGFYESSRRLETSQDWDHFSDQYAVQRRACLLQLQLDERSYPLPSWFSY
ncbi:MAG: hypothetical protein AAFV69_02180 [Pseudomonadota bacterium]